MHVSARRRLEDLEAAAAVTDDACPACGASWHGSTYRVAVEGVHRCVRCGAVRSAPAYRPRVMRRELAEAI